MNCKNCQTNLITEDKFCTKCGAKVITTKITFSSASEEFFSNFISWDNKFYKTLLHLFSKPEQVINGYLNGVRKRYMQPFAFLIIAITIYGIYIYFAKDSLFEYQDYLNAKFQRSGNLKTDQFTENMSRKINRFTVNYFNIVIFSSIPIIALLNLIVFRKRNFIEHCITLVYSNAHYYIVFSIFSTIALFFSIHLKYVYPITLVYMILYFMYFYKKVFKLSVKSIILKTLLFWACFFVIFLIIAIAGVIVGVILKINA